MPPFLDVFGKLTETGSKYNKLLIQKMRTVLSSLSLDEIKKIDLNPYTYLANSTQINMQDILQEAGVEHYKFLYWLAHSVNDASIIDIGTHLGGSAALLATNPTNTVYSFDIVKKGTLPVLENVLYYLQDLTEDETLDKWASKLLSSPFIFLDIDPHEGTREYKLYEWLKEKKYTGFLVADDVLKFSDMRKNFWDKIPDQEKLDLTFLGHHTGTGIIFFS